MASLATAEDAERLGYSLKSGQEEADLAKASARLRRAAGKPISSLTSTVTLDVTQGQVRLPGGPVTAVTAVAYTSDDGGGQITGWRWNRYNAIRCLPWVDQVVVTYTHGFTTVPEPLVDLVCCVAERLGAAGAATGMAVGKRSESIDDYSVTWAAEAREDAAGLLPGERAELERILGTPSAYVVRAK